MTGFGPGLVAAALLGLALLDGALAGFRSSLGRTGLIAHRTDDRRAGRRGLLLIVGLLAPAALVAGGDLLVHGAGASDYRRAGIGMLAVYAPYAALVLLALLVYGLLGWRQRYLASAVILGPFTLIRPLVAIAGGLVGLLLAPGVAASCAIVLAVAAVLAVQPLADRLWYDEPT